MARMQTYFRLHQKDDDPARLLDPENQKTEPWGGTVWGRCDKCGGTGTTRHECESCKASGRDENCPSCHGEMYYEEECPACQGTGEIDDSEREGVSVFPDEDGLYRYMVSRDADIEGSVLVALEGEPTEDEDFDADEGALLVRPTRIIEVRPVDEQRLKAATAGRKG
jgi:hypothetical protein